MKLHLLASAVLAAVFSVNAMAVDEATAAIYEADCRKYADEDKVPASELDDYMKQCIADMVAAGEAEHPSQRSSGSE